jgi:hypothetical protein
MGKTICPGCSGRRVRRSPRRGFFEETLLRLVRMRPYRCYDCDRRFFAATQPKTDNSGESLQTGSEVAEVPRAHSGESGPQEPMDTPA